MVSRIVVPLDESAFSEAAIPVADELASAIGAEVVLLAAGWGSTVEELQTYLDSKVTAFAGAVSTAVSPDTFPATAIADALDSADDAVVMSTHGRSGIGRALLGSVAEDVLHRTDQAVMLLGPKVSEFTSFKGRTLAVSTDGSPVSSIILPRAAAWAKVLDMTVRIVSVTAAGGTPIGGEEPEILERAVSSAVAYFTELGISAESASILGGDASESIVDWIDSNDVGLFAMATHGRGGLARTALGSTTMKVVHDSPCPVLVQKSTR